MQTNTLSIEAVLQLHQREIEKNNDDISKNKDNYHQLDKSLSELSKDVKSILDKLDVMMDNNEKLEKELKIHDGRITKIEFIHNKREWWLSFIMTILKRSSQLWWLWLILIMGCFAFQVDIKVKNPDLASLFVQVLKSKLS